MIPYGRQSISQDDIDAVTSVLKSDFITQGPLVPQFEERVANICGAAHAVAVNSATSALHLACLALEVGPGDVVWTSPITFVASANCALFCGATVDFVDIDPNTANISVEHLEQKLMEAKSVARLPKVVIPVHFAGEPAEMAKIHDLSKAFGFAIIEDASHAIGGRYKDSRIGSCQYSDITVFSFHPVKIITTGEGGMALTQRKELADKMQLMRSHGVTRDGELMTCRPHGPWYYQQVALGFNYRMTELQAGLGLSQLNRLEQFIERRHYLAKTYDDALGGLPVSPLERNPVNFSALHLYVVRLQSERIDRSREDVFEAMRSAGVGVNVHYIPVHTQPFYEAMGFEMGDFPEAEKYYEEALTLPLFPDLSDQQQQRVVNIFRDCIT